MFLCVFVYIHVLGAEKAPTWDACDCRWTEWTPWSACTANCGGGSQRRSRGVRLLDTPECRVFTACATSGSGWQTRACNTQCFNGGSFIYIPGRYYGYCHCADGKKGQCCTESKFIARNCTSFLVLKKSICVKFLSISRLIQLKSNTETNVC